MQYRMAILLTIVFCAGCEFLPQRHLRPTLHNPFPQLSSIAVLPFLNKSQAATVNGREFAEAYYNELQQIPGFDVVSVSTVEETMKRHDITIQSVEDVYRLGQLLGVDVVVVGAVNDFEPFYPPRCALEVEWYAMNPCFHSIPPGYGLPWGTAAERHIPDQIVLQTEMSLARAQMATQTPIPPRPGPSGATSPETGPATHDDQAPMPPAGPTRFDLEQPSAVTRASHAEPALASAGQNVAGAVPPGLPPGLPPNWPDPRGLIPDGPLPERPPCVFSGEPVMRHTAIYNANSSDFTAALQSYHRFQDDNRIGDWRHYMRRSNDFIRFSCRLHIWEMLSARGGAGESRVVWELPKCR